MVETARNHASHPHFDMFIPCLYHVYTVFVPGLYCDCTMLIPCFYDVYTVFVPCFYHVYIMLILIINHAYTMFTTCLCDIHTVFMPLFIFLDDSTSRNHSNWSNWRRTASNCLAGKAKRWPFWCWEMLGVFLRLASPGRIGAWDVEIWCVYIYIFMCICIYIYIYDMI